MALERLGVDFCVVDPLLDVEFFEKLRMNFADCSNAEAIDEEVGLAAWMKSGVFGGSKGEGRDAEAL